MSVRRESERRRSLVVVSRHDHCRPIAERHGIPYVVLDGHRTVVFA